MNESKFIQSIHRRLPATVDAWKISDRYTRGVPDVYYSGPQGQSLWVEYKYIAKTPATFLPKLTALQARWLRHHHNRGHNVALVCATQEGALILRFPDWLFPLSKAHFLERRLSKEALAEWIAAEISKI